jgi:hypothetical protein
MAHAGFPQFRDDLCAPRRLHRIRAYPYLPVPALWTGVARRHGDPALCRTALVRASAGRAQRVFDTPRLAAVDRAVRSVGRGGRYHRALAYWRPPGGASDNGRRRTCLFRRKRRGHAVAPHPFSAYGRFRHCRHVVRDLIGRFHPCCAVESHVVVGPRHLRHGLLRSQLRHRRGVSNDADVLVHLYPRQN